MRSEAKEHGTTPTSSTMKKIAGKFPGVSGDVSGCSGRGTSTAEERVELDAKTTPPPIIWMPPMELEEAKSLIMEFTEKKHAGSSKPPTARQ